MLLSKFAKKCEIHNVKFIPQTRARQHMENNSTLHVFTQTDSELLTGTCSISLLKQKDCFNPCRVISVAA